MCIKRQSTHKSDIFCTVQWLWQTTSLPGGKSVGWRNLLSRWCISCLALLLPYHLELHVPIFLQIEWNLIRYMKTLMLGRVGEICCKEPLVSWVQCIFWFNSSFWERAKMSSYPQTIKTKLFLGFICEWISSLLVISSVIFNIW